MTPDYRKITHALNFLAKEFDGILNRMKAIKLLYLADRYHLRRYGRPLSCDKYYAMKNGPVGSHAMNITNDSDFLDEEVREYSRKYLKPEGEHDFRSIREVDQTTFSETDLEALSFSIRNYGKFDKWELVDLTHVFPEWKMHEHQLKALESRVPMDYQDFFNDPDTNNPILARYFASGDIFQKEAHKSAKDRFWDWSQSDKIWQ